MKRAADLFFVFVLVICCKSSSTIACQKKLKPLTLIGHLQHFYALPAPLQRMVIEYLSTIRVLDKDFYRQPTPPVLPILVIQTNRLNQMCSARLLDLRKRKDGLPIVVKYVDSAMLGPEDVTCLVIQDDNLQCYILGEAHGYLLQQTPQHSQDGKSWFAKLDSANNYRHVSKFSELAELKKRLL